MDAPSSLREYQRKLAERLRNAAGGGAAFKLGVQVGAQAWLVDLADAAEMIPVPPVTQAPLTRAWFRGLANVRGRLYGVVDFAAFLGGAATQRSEQARLLLLAERFRMASALLVNGSLGLHDPARLAPAERSAARPAWLKGEYRDADGRAWMELDVAQLVQQREFLAVGAYEEMNP